ncbi:MAG: hypothetical protein OXT49_07985 [Gammaproteobacteria bacterium]|nr:hypothetical protein [Gammaproteobacteria bacterium]
MSKHDIAEAAARIMHDQCLQDYGLAKRKALEALSLPAHSALPENQLINAALQEHMALFATAADHEWTEKLIEAAKQASIFLANFPHYIGGSLAFKAAKQEDRLEIHLYDDTPESLLWQLQDHGIPYREQERIVRINRNTEVSYPCFSFVANDVPVSITVFPDSRPRPRPCDIDGSPLPRIKQGKH